MVSKPRYHFLISEVFSLRERHLIAVKRKEIRLSPFIVALTSEIGNPVFEIKKTTLLYWAVQSGFSHADI